jgi:hypothetical protein
MSKESWLEEFYPETAAACAARTKDPKEVVAHSLRKWRGTTPENLAYHGLESSGGDPFDRMTGTYAMVFNGANCSLCAAYAGGGGASLSTEDHACSRCPIYQTKDRTCAPEFAETLTSTQPMIRLLEEVAEALAAKETA